jgi:pimeloyl-ACP methyl ester carboxylesterase
MSQSRNVVLVHGAFADGSGWRGVYDRLQAEGYNVSVVQNAAVSLDQDEVLTRQILSAQEGPTVLVGHSYGGAVISAAGTHENVSGLVYVAAFAPDKGESIGDLISNPPPGVEAPPILPPQNELLYVDPAKFPGAFAADVPIADAEFMAISQVPWGLGALSTPQTDPAWKSKPTWYLVATEDHMIPPPAQQMMAERAGATLIEVDASHAVYVSQPAAVASLIMQAANA